MCSPIKAPTTTVRLVELAACHGIELDSQELRFEEAGLDCRVVFARGADGEDWVLRVPRRPDVSAKLEVERRILSFVAPRLSVAVPIWEVCEPDLVAYRQLPGEPGLTLDADGRPIWRFDPSSPEFGAALGRLVAELQGLDATAAIDSGVPVMTMADVRGAWRTAFGRVQEGFAVARHLRERWEAWLADDRFWPAPTAFTHGELYAAHVLIKSPERIVGVLDWTTAKVADPAVDFTYQHMMGPAAFESTVAAYLEAGGRAHPFLADRCAALAGAAPILYGLFALESREPAHLAAAAAGLDPDVA